MKYVERSELQRIRLSKGLVEQYHRKTASKRELVFLSHSHEDADIVSQAAALISKYGYELFIDWKDHTMPDVTGPATAERLKAKIRELDKFILLATNNALASRWVPWELGITDAYNGPNNVAIMPVADFGTWQRSEYIAIYPKIGRAEHGDREGDLFVKFPDGSNSVWLETWLA